MIVLKEGDILAIPEGYITVEACLGNVGADTIAYTFLLQSNVPTWMQQARILNSQRLDILMFFGSLMSYVCCFTLLQYNFKM